MNKRVKKKKNTLRKHKEKFEKIGSTRYKNAREEGVFLHLILCLIMYIMLTLIKKDSIITDCYLFVNNRETIDKCIFIDSFRMPFLRLVYEK